MNADHPRTNARASLPHRFGGALRRLGRDRDGAAAIEFGLVIPIFIVLMLGVVEFSRILVVRNSMQYAVEETARYAMVRSNAAAETLVDMVRKKVVAPDPENIDVAVSTETASGVTYRRITASYKISMLTALFGSEALTLSGTSRMPAYN